MIKSKDMMKSKLVNKYKILMNINIILRLCFNNLKMNKQKLKKFFYVRIGRRILKYNKIRVIY